MAKKKIALAGLDTLLKESVQTNQSVQSFESKTGQAMERGSYPLEQILPDPDQPRDVLTLELYDALFQGDSAQAVLGQWLTLGQREPLIQSKIDKVIYLANTIQIHGLINPITISRNSNVKLDARYLIVTGERRFWAHQYLQYTQAKIDDQSVQFILARIAEPKQKTAVQLIENLARERLNVFETARAIGSLKEEMGEGTQWGDVEEILQISRSYRTRILRVLKLGDRAVEVIQQHDLTERSIRPLIDAYAKNLPAQNEAFNLLDQNLRQFEEPQIKQIIAQVNKNNTSLPSKNKASTPNSFKKVHQFNRFLKKGGGELKTHSLTDADRKALQEISDVIQALLNR
ncbi:MAG: ParB/RepB/Spo0J family partition protein [Chloroflexota bacterium]